MAVLLCSGPVRKLNVSSGNPIFGKAVRQDETNKVAILEACNAPLPAGPTLRELLAYVKKVRSLACSVYREGVIDRLDYAVYLRYLKENPAELDTLAIKINRFFEKFLIFSSSR